MRNCTKIIYLGNIFSRSNFFKALWAGLTNQHDILDFFADTPLDAVVISKKESKMHPIVGLACRQNYSNVLVWVSKYSLE